MKRRFKKANINFLSLCPRGVNRLPVIYKAEGEVLDLDTICKVSKNFADNGEITAVVYAPEFRDSQGDIASAEVIKDAMYTAAREGRLSIDVRHNEKAVPKSDAFIAESFIVQKGDPRFDGMKDYSGEPVDVTGAWAVVLKIENAELRKAYSSGEWNGISMGGTAAVELEKSDDKSDKVLKKLSKLLKGKDDIQMDKKELTETLTANNAAIATAVAEAVAKALKPEAPVLKEEKPATGHVLTAPIFKGDMGDPKAVKAHALAVKKYKLAKACDFNDEESVAAYLAEIEKLDGTAPTEKKVEKPEREIQLEKELADERKRTNQPMSNDKPGAEPTNITKADDLFKLGATMAAGVNQQRGYGTK